MFRFYGGNLIFRGHFNSTLLETAVNLTIQGGFAFGYSAFLNGVFLGSNQGSPTVSAITDIWSIPNNTLRMGDNVLTVIQGVSLCISPYPRSYFLQIIWGKWSESYMGLFYPKASHHYK